MLRKFESMKEALEEIDVSRRTLDRVGLSYQEDEKIYERWRVGIDEEILIRAGTDGERCPKCGGFCEMKSDYHRCVECNYEFTHPFYVYEEDRTDE